MPHMQPRMHMGSLDWTTYLICGYYMQSGHYGQNALALCRHIYGGINIVRLHMRPTYHRANVCLVHLVLYDHICGHSFRGHANKACLT